MLPFTNLSDDREQQYFADGITEDLTTDLSRIADMFVISRNTAFTYRSKPVDTKQIGRELGVRYVLEGSVRRSGNQVRVNAQLIDAETDAHLWAERFDRDTGDLFALQNEITSRIAVALNLELVAAEAARPTEHPDALDYILRGRAACSKPPVARKLCRGNRPVRARVGARSAVRRGTELVGAARSRAACSIDMTDSAAADIARAEELVAQALAASPRSPLAHFAKGQVLRAQGRCDEAIPEYETALALNRNWVVAISRTRLVQDLHRVDRGGDPARRSKPSASARAIPTSALWYVWIGHVHLLQSRTDEAILWLEKARSANPAHPTSSRPSRLRLRPQRRDRTRRRRTRRSPQAEPRRSLFEHRPPEGHRTFGRAEYRALFEATYLAGLRKAGMPEE